MVVWGVRHQVLRPIRAIFCGCSHGRLRQRLKAPNRLLFSEHGDCVAGRPTAGFILLPVELGCTRDQEVADASLCVVLVHTSGVGKRVAREFNMLPRRKHKMPERYLVKDWSILGVL